MTDDEKSSTEILSDTDSSESSNEVTDYRRKQKTEDGSDSDASSEYEKNPGNPYTVHKNRYKQNWMWNHVMTGDHMNINPYAPRYNNYGPSATNLFFGRKWWYFNQDDYKPFN